MRLQSLLVALLISLLSVAGADPVVPVVTVKDGWFMVNGERFFVKGIGYQLHGGPGQIPRERTFDPEIMAYDLALLEQGGFNTVRAWDPYSVEELEVFRQHGMMVIQGFWFDIAQYLRDEAYARQSQEALAEVVRSSKGFDNILFYTIMNEPHADALIKAGMDSYGRACREMKEVARQEDPDCLVTYSHCSRNEFLDESMWDVVFFNDYLYAPNTVSTALKYRGHVEWLRRLHAAGKPFVLGEFGLSVSPSGPGKMGYGGNTLAEQRDGDLAMYQAMIDAGGQGGCLFMWKDGWWKHGDKMKHDDHPEEWYGVLGIDDWQSDPRGTPRPVYDAFKEYNQLILTEPRQLVVYPKDVPVDAYVTKSVTSVRCRVDGGQWAELAASSPAWRRGRLGNLTDGHHTVEVVANLARADGTEIRRSVDVIVGDPQRALPTLTLTTARTVYEYGETAVVQVRATTANGDPLPDLAVVGTYQNHANGEGRTFVGKTAANGLFETPFPLFVKPTFITLAAGADVQIHGVAHRLSDATIIEVKGLPQEDVEAAARLPGRLLMGFEYGTKEALDQAVRRTLAGNATYVVDRETGQVKEGAVALALRLEPTGERSWGYTEVLFETVQNMASAKAVSYWLYGDGSGQSLKVMWIDQDRERWLGDPVLIDFTGWRRIVFSPRTPQRDPFDGITDGDGRPNPGVVAGLAFVMNSTGRAASSVILDAITAHE